MIKKTLSTKPRLASWLSTGLVLFTLFFLSALLADKPIDPWGLLNPRKISFLLFALILIQVLANLMIRGLGEKAGSIAAGFLGGLVSSTALTATIARESKTHSKTFVSYGALSLLSASLAMLIEAMILVVLGIQGPPLSLFIIFSGPIVLSIVLIVIEANKHIRPPQTIIQNLDFKWLPTLALAAVILVVLAISKILQNYFGDSGLVVVTFLTSLFEIHGSIIANTQLFELGSVNTRLLGGLLAIALAASYFSKAFLILSLAGPSLKKWMSYWILLIFSSLVASWLIFTSMIA